MLIRSPALGRSLAAALGDAAVVLMRGHGSTVVGTSLRQAVFRALYAETNARAQGTAMKIGEVTYLTPGEAAAASTTNDGQIGRAFDLWKFEASDTSRGEKR